MATRAPREAYYYLDGQLLSDEHGRRKEDWWRWDDFFLSMVVLVGALQDLGWGIWRLGWPDHFLETINSVVIASIDADTTRLTRVGAFGQLEAGLCGILLVAYRSARWYTHHPFNGVNYQLAFLVNAIGKTSAFIYNEYLLDFENFGNTDGHPLDRYFLLTRAGLALIAFTMSLWTYRDSWKWACGP
jgi:hypothetical protein